MVKSRKHRAASRYEREKSKAHRGKHLGGPGKPDYTRGETIGEIKHWRKPLDSETLKKLVRRGITEVDNLGGFTKPAIEYAAKRDVRLFQRNKRIK